MADETFSLSAADLDDIFRTANETNEVQSVVLTEAHKVLARARRIDQQENGGRGNIRLETGYYENGRFYAKIVSDDVVGEYGNKTTPRRATLRRAGGA